MESFKMSESNNKKNAKTEIDITTADNPSVKITKKVKEVNQVKEIKAVKSSKVKSTAIDENTANMSNAKQMKDAEDKAKASKTVTKKSKAPQSPAEKNLEVALPSNELTEQALLSMPDCDYMNADQLAFFKKRLQKIRHDILENADQTTENLRETVHVPDPVDRASIEEEHALELRTRDRERKLLAKIEQSLRKIEDGSYGWCDETGEPIGVPRLLARPTANLCLEAQERRELRQKMFGD
jgi:DnaK suppressor protein